MTVMNTRNIVLIGFMGCGKTTVGMALSQLIHYDFLDCDILIEQKCGMTISNIFSEFGESYFRKIETEVMAEVSKLECCVIATGGGVIKNPDNMDLLQKNSSVVYLKATPEQIFKNVKEDHTRPILQTNNKFEKISILMNEREPFYQQYADFSIEVGEKSVTEITDKILEILEIK